MIRMALPHVFISAAKAVEFYYTACLTEDVVAPISQ